MFVNAPFILTVTHSVSSGSVGIQADIKTMTVLGGFGLGVTTAVSTQSDGSLAISPIDPEFVRLQLASVLRDFPVAAAKTGRLISPATIKIVAEAFQKRNFPLVVDPVCVSHIGTRLLDDESVAALRQYIVPVADVLTPNLREAELLSGVTVRHHEDMIAAGRRLLTMGAKAVLITGSDRASRRDDAGQKNGPRMITDWLIMPHRKPVPLSQPWVDTCNTVGSGNTLAAAIATLVTEDIALASVIAKAQTYLNLCLSSSHMLSQGGSVPDLAAPLRSSMVFAASRTLTRAEQMGIIGTSPALLKSLQTASGLAPSLVPVLIQGETGTGKGLCAAYIHAISGRGTFVSVNCAAIPEPLIESTLFGHKKGAFTGAIADLKGQFEMADGGTLFLDEIAEMPPSSQVKLLRVLESGMLQVLGEAAPKKVDVRIIAATNQNLKQLMHEKAFREDLYYRLNVGVIHLPQLREREQDIPALAQHCLDRVNATLPAPRFFTPKALAALRLYPWPGNVRELYNVVECSARLSPHRMIDVEALSLPHSTSPSLLSLPLAGNLAEHIAAVRDACIVNAVERSHKNYSEAARVLGLTPQAVSRHMRLRGQESTKPTQG